MVGQIPARHPGMSECDIKTNVAARLSAALSASTDRDPGVLLAGQGRKRSVLGRHPTARPALIPAAFNQPTPVMTTQSHLPARLVLGLAVAIASDTALQLVWKTGIAGIPDTSSVWEIVVAVASAPIFLVVIALMAIQLVNWLKVLDHADLSFAKPFTSLSYVTVCLLSVFYLDERIDPMQIVGIAIVVGGVWCVASTPRNTIAPGEAPR